MKTLKILAGAAALASASLSVAAPVAAQVQSVAIVDVEGAIVQSQAYQNAVQAIRQQYASQIQQIDTRRQALQTQLQGLQQTYQQTASQENADQNALRQQAQQIQQVQQAAQQELGTLEQPISLAQAYAAEQVQVQLTAAVRAAMQQAGVGIVLRPEAAVLAADPAAANLTDETVAQLNSLVQSVQTAPPQGWQPGQTLQAARQSQQPAQPQQ
ncbi:OmpH family outer membrane protein [Pacificimonas flava]|uniref:Outer membrane protein H n=1 Tax=Pacificimonas flava TaxID=1234595 RepID=M2TRY7_9SPHN|nr:OmpH family outer membrane protein [Pacificimonas flava]EMD84561.1 hypothetical protein C725_0491 [Pacificimonas flava]MBB5279569.1 Skp family chaperone for outer membrane proteins [Pacificimonas flava]